MLPPSAPFATVLLLALGLTCSACGETSDAERQFRDCGPLQSEACGLTWSCDTSASAAAANLSGVCDSGERRSSGEGCGFDIVLSRSAADSAEVGYYDSTGLVGWFTTTDVIADARCAGTVPTACADPFEGIPLDPEVDLCEAL